MALNVKKARHELLNTKDRLSGLPNSILRHIIFLLGSDEACRTTILSKRWSHIWPTTLFLEFKPHFFEDKSVARLISDPHTEETLERFLSFIETTMRRYSEQNLSIRKFELEYPTIKSWLGSDVQNHNAKMSERIDRWLGIAVRNQVESLSLSISVTSPSTFSYELPDILVSAESLISLKCRRLRVIYSLALSLGSLQSLELIEVDIHEHMLLNIINSCPVKLLLLSKCTGLRDIFIPHHSKLESLHVSETVPIGATIVVDTPGFQRFTYGGYGGNQFIHINSWPFTLRPAASKNLRVLNIFSVVIFDKIIDKLVPELLSIKDMAFHDCIMPKSIRIVSRTLEKLGIHDSHDLVNIATEAPNLETFCYCGDLTLSTLIINQTKCNTYLSFNLKDNNLDTRGFLRIKQLISSTNCCKMSVNLINVLEVRFGEHEVSKIQDGPPYDVPELKLSVSSFIPVAESCLTALIDGLFWSCRPAILSLPVSLKFDRPNNVVKTLLEILEKKAKSWKHPLKRFEVHGSTEPCLRLRIFW